MSVASFSDESHPSFRPFSWHHDDVPPPHHKTLAELSHDIGHGMATLLALIEYNEMERLDDKPFLTEVDQGSLLRMAIATSKLLGQCAHEQITQANRRQDQPAQAAMS